jgi:hypothetical protein
MTIENELIDRAMEGALGGAEEEALGRRLRESPAFARRYLEAALEESVLADLAREATPADVAGSSGIRWGGLLTMAASVLMCASVLWSIFAVPAGQAPEARLTITFKKGDRFTVITQAKVETTGLERFSLEGEFVMSYRVLEVSKDGVASIKGVPKSVRLKGKFQNKSAGTIEATWNDSMPPDKVAHPTVRDFIKNGLSFSVDAQGGVLRPELAKRDGTLYEDLPFVRGMPRQMLMSLSGTLSGAASAVGDSWTNDGDWKKTYYNVSTRYSCSLEQRKENTAVVRSTYASQSKSDRNTFLDEATEGQGTTQIDLKRNLPVKSHFSYTHLDYTYKALDKSDKTEILRERVELDSSFRKE